MIEKGLTSAESKLISGEFLDFATKIATDAGKLLIKRRGKGKLLSVTSDNNKGLVMDTDLQTDDLILNAITLQYPNHAVLTEESGETEGSEYQWVVDPVDGTNNYRRGDPNFSVSIGLRKGNRGVLGVVFAPVTDSLYFATVGKGAFVKIANKTQKLQVSGKESLDMFTMSFAVGIDFNNPQMADQTLVGIRNSELFSNFRRRMFESTALELCYIAEGRFDAHFNNFAKPWDIAAGEVIVREAGGITTKIEEEILLASNGVIHDNLLQVIELVNKKN